MLLEVPVPSQRYRFCLFLKFSKWILELFRLCGSFCFYFNSYWINISKILCEYNYSKHISTNNRKSQVSVYFILFDICLDIHLWKQINWTFVQMETVFDFQKSTCVQTYLKCFGNRLKKLFKKFCIHTIQKLKCFENVYVKCFR